MFPLKKYTSLILEAWLDCLNLHLDCQWHSSPIMPGLSQAQLCCGHLWCEPRAPSRSSGTHSSEGQIGTDLPSVTYHFLCLLVWLPANPSLAFLTNFPDLRSGVKYSIN